MRKLIPVLALALLVASLMIFIGCSSEEDPVTPPPACSITMTTPTAGDEYFSGDPVNIRWTTSGTPGTVDIELVSGAQDTFIAEGADNSGFYPWSIKAYNFGSRDNFQIRVTGTGEPACSDITGQFAITSLSNCDITFPYSEKDTIPTQMAGDIFTINWTSANTSGEVQLELWTTSPAPAYTPKEPVYIIDPAAEDTESYDWTVSSFNYSDNAVYRFRIKDTHLATCTDTSIPFRIIDNSVCSLVLGGIDGGQTYNPGETINIAVIGTNLPGLVDLRLDGATGAVPNGTIVNNWDPSTGSFLWTVTDFGWAGSNAYRIRATSSDDPYCTEVSLMFSIAR